MIPFVDIKRQHDASVKKDFFSAIDKIIDSSEFTLGQEVTKFEKEFAKYCGVKYAVGVGNGSDAITLTLAALGIGNGDEVISVANTFAATIDAPIHLGAKPILVDCDEYFNIDVKQIEARITKSTKVILPVHLYGQMANMTEIMKIAKKHKLLVVEDCAQAHGAKFNGKKSGSFGVAGCFSFYPGKNLGAMGDGGIIVTNKKSLYDQLLRLRNFGQGKDKYHHQIVGYNSRLHTLQAAILRLKLKKLNVWNSERQKLAKLYTQLLEGVVETPKVINGANHVYHLYVVKTKRRDQLLSELHKNKIYAGLHYPIPLHLQKAYQFLGYKKGDFPIAEKNAKMILSLPIFPGMTPKEVIEVVENVKKTLATS